MANEMTVSKLKELCDKANADGFGDGPKVFSLESNPVNENDPKERKLNNDFYRN